MIGRGKMRGGGGGGGLGRGGERIKNPAKMEKIDGEEGRKIRIER